MRRAGRQKFIINAIVFALAFCLTVRPSLNAADPESAAARSPLSLSESLFLHAKDFSRALHERPLEERSNTDYRRALDAYNQVIRLNTDTFFTAESLLRMAELQREMADSTGDSAIYQQSIETLKRIIADHPQSSFVGDSLIAIAEIYEENLQDLDGAARAYRELIEHYPNTVMAREARAVLTRFEAQLSNRPADVFVSGEITAGDLAQSSNRARLTNVRNFSGPDYARVVIDLSGETVYEDSRAGANRLSLLLSGALVSPSLYGRRFIVGESSLLKRIVVSSDSASSVKVDIDVSSLSDHSVFRLSDPERIVIDLHAAGTAARPRYSIAPDSHESEEAEDGETASAARADSRPPSGSSGKVVGPASRGEAILALPEITEPIMPFNAADVKPAAPSAGAVATTVDGRTADAPVKCVVIDPGHGGHDTGTISPGGMKEKDLVLDVARRLRSYIKRNYPDVEVILTRDADRFIALEERTAIANSRRADLFISIHANASPSKAASGVETFFLSPDRAKSEDLQAANRENAKSASDSTADKLQPVVASVTVGNRVAESRELARYIQAGLVRGIGAASPRTAANRGVKHAPFVVLLGAAMPSVLAEVSFMSNPRDEALLQTSAFRERIAASLFAGFNSYLKKNRAAAQKPTK
ncbi:MAG TPA: N-acetylmuramoyl-L-alanine amidase [Blastocatellia bacterium]|nr:N-acetylmuramoyl-L-alanine amidase [Blastocatellia bacterium]